MVESGTRPVIDTNQPSAGKQTIHADESRRPKQPLFIDTTVARHRVAPQQHATVQNLRRSGLQFGNLQDVEALRPNATNEAGHVPRRDDAATTHVRPGPQRTVRHGDDRQEGKRYGHHRQSSAATLDTTTPIKGMTLSALHKVIGRLRPSPSDVFSGISPSDRAIPIGLAISSDEPAPSSTTTTTANPTRQVVATATLQQSQLAAQTPTISITPARSTFALTSSPQDFRLNTRRPTSSVYSRCTNYIPRTTEIEQYPRVPPLPPLNSIQRLRSRGAGGQEEGVEVTSDANVLNNRDSIRQQTPIWNGRPFISLSARSTTQSVKGWWNVITSPFLSSPRQFMPSLSSPARYHEEEKLLSDEEQMGISDKSVPFQSEDRADGEFVLRSAPPNMIVETDQDSTLRQLKRSDTAPGALDPSSCTVNIYRVYSQGEAAAYYDPLQRFLSFIRPSGTRALESPIDWSPSQSVFREAREKSDSGLLASDSDKVLDGEDSASAITRTTKSTEIGGTATNSALSGVPYDATESAIRSNMAADNSTVHEGPSSNNECGDMAQFSTPSMSELASPVQSAPVQKELVASQFSPYSATTVLDDAQTATFVRLRSFNEQPKAIDSAKLREDGTATFATGTVAPKDIHQDTYDELEGKSSSTQAAEPAIDTNVYDMEKGLAQPSDGPSENATLFADGVDRFATKSNKRVGQQAARSLWRRFAWSLVGAGLVLAMATVVLMVMLIPQTRESGLVQGQWLNLTGFPPLPVGVMTVIQPALIDQVDGCVSPKDLWSCAAPDGATGSQQTGLPNFRLEISFKNDSTGAFNRTDLQPTLSRRSSWAEYLFSPSPNPPSTADQTFIGETTDHNGSPFDGEPTPFFISLLNTSSLETVAHTSLHRRDESKWHWPLPSSSAPSSTSDGSTSLGTAAASNIPMPATNKDDDPLPAELYPYVYAQPLRIYNRGLDSEHYGFYTYYSRFLYVSDTINATSSKQANTDSAVSTSVLSTVPVGDASAVCTWSQTRMLVQIWTRRSGPPVPTSATGVALASSDSKAGVRADNSTANAMTAPGSFPYSVTFTIDRHGGEAGKKGVSCFGMSNSRVIDSVRAWINEDRAFGGTLINPALVPGNETQAQKRDDGVSGGIDGGTGGCLCRWQS